MNGLRRRVEELEARLVASRPVPLYISVGSIDDIPALTIPIKVYIGITPDVWDFTPAESAEEARLDDAFYG